MIKIIKNIKTIGIVLLSIVCFYLGYKLFNKKKEIVKVPIRIEVPIPGSITTFEPYDLPLPKKERPRPKLVKDFQKSDSITKDSLYNDAITERTYDLNYSDSTQTTNVKSIVQGKLLKQEVTTEIYPSSVTLDTVVSMEIPKKGQLRLRGAVGVPALQQDILGRPIIKGGFEYITKKKMGYSIEIDSRRYIWVGVSIKL